MKHKHKWAVLELVPESYLDKDTVLSKWEYTKIGWTSPKINLSVLVACSCGAYKLVKGKELKK